MLSPGFMRQNVVRINKMVCLKISSFSARGRFYQNNLVCKCCVCGTLVTDTFPLGLFLFSRIFIHVELKPNDINYKPKL